MLTMPRTVTLRIKNWRDFTKVLYVMRGGAWLYRGQEDASWLLQSSLDRELEVNSIDNPAEAERSNIGLFMANSKLLGDSTATIEALKRPGAAVPAKAGDAVVAPRQAGAQ